MMCNVSLSIFSKHCLYLCVCRLQIWMLWSSHLGWFITALLLCSLTRSSENRFKMSSEYSHKWRSISHFLPLSCWSHVPIGATSLVLIRPDCRYVVPLTSWPLSSVCDALFHFFSCLPYTIYIIFSLCWASLSLSLSMFLSLSIPHSVSQKRHRSSDSAASGRDRSYSTDSAELLPVRCKEEQDICSAFMQQYVQYLQSLGFILVQVRPPSPARRYLHTHTHTMMS